MKNNVSLSDSGWNLQSSYTQISDKLFSELKPDAVTNPSTVIVNNELAEKLGLNLKSISEEDLSNLFSGKFTASWFKAICTGLCRTPIWTIYNSWRR